MRRRQVLKWIGGASTAAVAGCADPLRAPGTVLAAVHASNQTNEDQTVEVIVERDDEPVGEGTLEVARHRTDQGSPYGDLDCTWPTTERGTFTITARMQHEPKAGRRRR